jgi:glycosyltransferase involved in cell wall biosynthesis
LPNKGLNKLRILHIIDHIYPILGYQETFIAKAHSGTHETLVITSDRYAESIYDSNRHLLGKKIVGGGIFFEEGLNILRLPAKFNSDFLSMPWLIGLEKAVTIFKPDIIIVHGVVNLTSIRLAMLKSKLPNCKMIFDDHMTYNASREGWTGLVYKLFKTVFTPQFLKSANAFIAVTPETREFMHLTYGIPFERIKIIPLGIDSTIFRYDSKIRNRFRRNYGIEDGEVVFIYAGKIIPAKGVHLLVDAGLQVCQSHSKVRFMIVGGEKNSYSDALRKKIFDRGMNDYFIFVDAVANRELSKYYCAADAGVWPLQCSISMLEATACGLPTIISDRCGAVERVASGNGLLYKEYNVNDLAKKIIYLLDEEKRKEMSEKATAFVKTFDWSDLAARFLQT